MRRVYKDFVVFSKENAVLGLYYRIIFLSNSDHHDLKLSL